MNLKPLTQEELINVIGTFHLVLKRTLSQFSDETLNTVPFEKSWTASQVAEHIIKSQQYIIEQLSEGTVLTAGRVYDQKVNMIQEIFRNKEIKAKTDKSIAPGPPSHHLLTLLEHYKSKKSNRSKSSKQRNLRNLVPYWNFPA